MLDSTDLTRNEPKPDTLAQNGSAEAIPGLRGSKESWFGSGIQKLVMLLVLAVMASCKGDDKDDIPLTSAIEAIARITNPESAQFQAEIANAFREGYLVQFSGATAGFEMADSGPLPLNFHSLLDGLKYGFSSEYYFSFDEKECDPLAALARAKDQVKPGNKQKIIFAPLYKMIFNLAKDTIEIKVTNAFTGATVITHEWNIEEISDEYGLANSERIKTYFAPIITAMRKDKTYDFPAAFQLFKEREDLGEDVGMNNIPLMHPRGGGVRRLQKLDKEGWYVSVTRIPSHEVEEMSGSRFSLFTINTSRAAELDEEATIVIDGVITSVSVSRQSETKPIGGDETFVDKYGNTIIRTISSYMYEGKENYDERFLILVPKKAKKQENDESYSGWLADLSKYGIDLGTDLFFQKPASPLGKAGKYEVYGSQKGIEGIYENSKDKVEQMADGAKSGEEFFGFEPGNLVKSIFVVNTDSPNGSFNLGDPTNIVITDEWLKDPLTNIPANMKSIGFHETMHLIDALFEISEDPRFKDFFKTLNGDFCSAIDESTWFIEEDGFGGHSQDNEQEFLASFAVSLTPRGEKTLEERVNSLGDYNKAKYQEATRILKTVITEKLPQIQQMKELKGIAGSSKKLPILEVLDKVIEM